MIHKVRLNTLRHLPLLLTLTIPLLLISNYVKSQNNQSIVWNEGKSGHIQMLKGEEREQAIKKTEDYLDTLTSAQARFVQTTHDGTQLVGTFYLKRPGKLRFEYDEPVEDFVVADGFFIYFYDAELEEQTNAPIGQTLADFILRDNLRLRDDLLVEEVKRAGGLLQIKVTQSADPTAGSITLGLEENPMAIKKWRVIDAQGLLTEIELFYLDTNVTHNDELFIYSSPDSVVKYNP